MEVSRSQVLIIVFLQSPHLWKNVDILYLKIKAMNNVTTCSQGSGVIQWRNNF